MKNENNITRRGLLGGAAAAFVAALSGCMYQEEPMPEIVYNPPARPVTTRPTSKPVVTPAQNLYPDIPSNWIPYGVTERKWSAIVVHHSATEVGNATIFDTWHRENNGWDAVGYDFVIGNGSDSGDGQIEVTVRWTKQMVGAHCGGTNGNWANEEGIGICLVGDFNRSRPSTKQLQSLAKLVSFLQKRYNIPKNRIYGHRETPGARITDCPGHNFPMDQFKAML